MSRTPKLLILESLENVIEPITATYQRVTREESFKGISLEAQRSEAEKVCSRRGWNVVKHYTEPRCISGETLARESLQELIRDIKQGKIARILVRDEDRLWRSFECKIPIINVLKQHSVELWTFHGQIQYLTAQGEFTANILTSVAKFELAMTSRRLKLSRKVDSELGNTPYGVPVYGYDSQSSLTKRISDIEGISIEEAHAKAVQVIPYKKIWVPNEDEAKVVREMFELYCNPDPQLRMGTRRIAIHISAQGYRTRHGKKFCGNYIAKLLSNPYYAGYTYYDCEAFDKYLETKKAKNKQERYQGNHKAIVSKEVWHLAQQLRKENIKHLRDTFTNRNHYPLNNIIRCSCGEGYKGRSSGHTDVEGKYTYYFCKARRNFGKAVCNSPTIKQKDVEDVAFNFVYKAISDPSVLALLAKEINTSDTKMPVENEYIDKIKEVERKVQLYQDRFETAKSNDEQELCWARLVEFNSVLQELKELHKKSIPKDSSKKQVTLKDVEKYLAKLKAYFDGHPMNLRHLYQLLSKRHGFIIQVIDETTFRISMHIGLEDYSETISASGNCLGEDHDRPPGEEHFAAPAPSGPHRTDKSPRHRRHSRRGVATAADGGGEADALPPLGGHRPRPHRRGPRVPAGGGGPGPQGGALPRRGLRDLEGTPRGPQGANV